MATDHALGTVVGCPNCGTALAIPGPQPPAPLSPARTLPAASYGRPADGAQRERTIVIAIVSGLAVLWLLLAFPNVLLWVAGRPAASVERVGAGAVIFWVGVLLACGGMFEWSLFKYSRDMRATQAWFGEQGAKWFYAGLGSLAAVVGLGVTVSATAYSLFGTTESTPERPDFAAQRTIVQPLSGPQVSSASQPSTAPATQASTAAESPPPAAEKGAQQPTRNDFSELAGQWRYLDGGFCIKVPPSIVVSRDSTTRHDGRTQQNFGGCTLIGKPEGVNFAVDVSIDPRGQEFDSKFLYDFMRRQPPMNEFDMELIMVNGLPVVKTRMQHVQSGPLTNKQYTLHGTVYHFVEKRCTVRLAVYSQLPQNHPQQQALLPYLTTFRRMPKDQALAASTTGSAADGWQLLQGGFRIRTAREMEIRHNEITRHGAAYDKSTHHISGQTADDVQFKIDVIVEPSWNKPNEARQNAAENSRRAREDYEHVAEEVHGLLMERITRRPEPGRDGPTTVEYRYLDGPHQIILWAHSRLPLDHPSFQAVIRCFESIERAPEQ